VRYTTVVLQAFYASASVLAAEIARRLDRCVSLQGGGDARDTVLRSSCVVVLLTKNILVTPHCVVEMFVALQAGLPLVTILLQGGDYSFEDARSRLRGEVSAWGAGLADASFLVTLQTMLGDSTDLVEVQQVIFSSITSLIATHWVQHGSRNQFQAMLNDICERVPAKRNARRKSSFGRQGAEPRARARFENHASSLSDRTRSIRVCQSHSNLREKPACTQQTSSPSLVVKMGPSTLQGNKSQTSLEIDQPACASSSAA